MALTKVDSQLVNGAITTDSSGNVGIGTASPQGKLDVSSASAGVTAGDLVVDTTNKVVYVGRVSSTSGDNSKLMIRNRVGDALTITGDTTASGTGLFRPGTNTLGFAYNGTEAMRIDSSGNLFVDCTTTPNGTNRRGFQVLVNTGLGDTTAIQLATTTSSTRALGIFNNSNGNVGSLGTSGSSTYYATSSDYRLKENIAPMTGALDKVALLKPVTYKWKSTGEDSQGFIAHELQEVIPDAVYGEKDAINEDGSIKAQNIDTSFLVATLTAAIQELNAKFEEYKATHP